MMFMKLTIKVVAFFLGHPVYVHVNTPGYITSGYMNFDEKKDILLPIAMMNIQIY